MNAEQDSYDFTPPETGMPSEPVLVGGFTARAVSPVRLYVLLLLVGLCVLGDMFILKWLWEAANVALLAAYMGTNIALAMATLKRLGLF